MATIKELFAKELAELETLRDEIKVKAHLARADFKDEVAKLETQWPAVEKVAKDIEAASAEVATQLEKAGREVFADLRKGYESLVGKKDPADASKEPPGQA